MSPPTRRRHPPTEGRQLLPAALPRRLQLHRLGERGDERHAARGDVLQLRRRGRAGPRPSRTSCLAGRAPSTSRSAGRRPDLGLLAQVDETRAGVFIAEKKYREAERVIARAVRTLEGCGTPALFADALTTQGGTWARLGNIEGSINALRRAVKVAEDAGARSHAGPAILTPIEERGARRTFPQNSQLKGVPLAARPVEPLVRRAAVRHTHSYPTLTIYDRRYSPSASSLLNFLARSMPPPIFSAPNGST